MKSILGEAYRKGHFFYPSNLLSLLRVVLVAPMGIAVANGSQGWILVLAVAGVVTDALDGMLARKRNEITELGKILDPLADKLVIGTVVLVMIFKQTIPLWLAGAIIVRDLLILAGSFYLSKKMQSVPPSRMLGKITVNLVAAGILGHLFEISFLFPWFDYLVLVFLIASFIQYLFIFYQQLKQTTKEYR